MTFFADPTDPSMLSLVLLDVARALQEDLGSGDLTAGLIDPIRRARARVLARESAVICGGPWATAAVRAFAGPAAAVVDGANLGTGSGRRR